MTAVPRPQLVQHTPTLMQRQRIAVTLLFLLLGATLGSWASPSLTSRTTSASATAAGAP